MARKSRFRSLGSGFGRSGKAFLRKRRSKRPVGRFRRSSY